MSFTVKNRAQKNSQMRSLLILVLFSMQLASCNATRNVKLHKVSMGMTKDEVEKAVGKKPDNSICAKSYPDGHIEVVQYSRYELDAYFQPRLREQYWLFFYNKKLVKWQRSGGDCELEADRAYDTSLVSRS